MTPSSLQFVYSMERGYLEAQGLLSIAALRRFAGPLAESVVWVVQPRIGPPLRPETLEHLSRLGARFVRSNLNRECPDYPMANKPAAASFVEELVAGTVENLCYVDCDTLFVNPPTALMLPPGRQVGLTPVYNRGVGLKAEEGPSPFWKFLQEICGPVLDGDWTLATRMREENIRPYFNGGIVVGRPEVGVFRSWKLYLDQVMSERHRIRSAPGQWHYCEQAVLAASVLAQFERDEVEILDRRYNYPLRAGRGLAPHLRFATLEEAVHVDYGSAFQREDWREVVEVGETLGTWLNERLPLPAR